MISKIKCAIKKLPTPHKSFFYQVYSLMPIERRLGKQFTETLNLLKESQFWDEEKLKKYQWNKLKNIVEYSYAHVPYYKKLFDKLKIMPDDIKDHSDFAQLPFLTKPIIEKNFNQLIATNIPKNRILYARTGGTSGKPLIFCTDKLYSSTEHAFMFTQWARVGYDYKRSKRIGMKGKTFSKGHISGYDPRFNILYFSTFNMTPSFLDKYCEIIKRVRPDFLWTYPSAATMLANHILDQGISDLPSFKAILCSSENIYDYQRPLIERAFKCRMFTWYGHSERLILAGECEKNSEYHLFPEYGFLELVDQENRVINKPGVMGEMIGTGFRNYVMPLIRYRTNDYGEWAKSTKCACQRYYPRIKKTVGRWLQEMIVGKDDNLISMTALNTHSNIYDEVKQFQFYQEHKGKVTLNIVRKDNYTDLSTKKIFNELSKKFGQSVQLKIKFVNKLPKTLRGKHQFIIQTLPINFGKNNLNIND